MSTWAECQSVHTAMALGCVIEMEMSQSAATVVCCFYPVLLSQIHPLCSPLFLCECLFLRVGSCWFFFLFCFSCADNTRPFSFSPQA